MHLGHSLDLHLLSLPRLSVLKSLIDDGAAIGIGNELVVLAVNPRIYGAIGWSDRMGVRDSVDLRGDQAGCAKTTESAKSVMSKLYAQVQYIYPD
jgi:hypothetical protein